MLIPTTRDFGGGSVHANRSTTENLNFIQKRSKNVEFWSQAFWNCHIARNLGFGRFAQTGMQSAPAGSTLNPGGIYCLPAENLLNFTSLNIFSGAAVSSR